MKVQVQAEVVVYITRYALKRGIFKTKAILNSLGTAYVKPSTVRSFLQHENLYPINTRYRSREWFTSEEDALKVVEKMRERKIKALNRQSKKVQKMKFELVDLCDPKPYFYVGHFCASHDEIEAYSSEDGTYAAQLARLSARTNQPVANRD